MYTILSIKKVSSVLTPEIQIDQILKEGQDQYISLLSRKNNAVVPRETFDIQVGEVRFTQYYELKSSQSSEKIPFWKRWFKKKNQTCPISKYQIIEMKQRAMLRDFVYEGIETESWFQQMVSRAHLLPIIEPDSTFYMTWQVLNSMLVLFFLFEIPFLTFFEVSNEPNSHIFWVLVAAMVIYTLDMLISLNTAVYIQGILESDRKRIASHYLRNGFLVDIIPIIILGLQFFNRMTYYVGLLFYLKIYEILKLQENVYNTLRLRRRSVAIYSLTSLMLWMILICHIFACVFYGVGKRQYDLGSDSWLSQSSLKTMIISLPLSDQYSYAFYWSVTTMISVGYGDITPKNTPEVLITTFTMFVSCILFAYSINAIWEVIRELNENRYKFDKHVTAMSRFMYDHGVSRKLNTKINAYLSHMWDKDRKRDIESEQVMIKKLAPGLREELMFDTLGQFLQRTPFFLEHFSIDFLRELSLDIEEVRFSAGEVIFMQDDPQWDDKSLYYIADGSLQLYLQQGTVPHVLNNLVTGQTFGWVGFVGGIRRTASVKCLTYSIVYKLNRQRFLSRLEAYPKDKQVFHQLRDNYLFYNRIGKFGLKCYICDSQKHLAETCDKTHFIPKKDQISDAYRKINLRDASFKRRGRPAFSAWRRHKEVIREARYMKRFTIEYGSDRHSFEQEQDEEEEQEQELQELPRSKQATENSIQASEEHVEPWEMQNRCTGQFQSLQNEFISLQPLSTSMWLNEPVTTPRSQKKRKTSLVPSQDMAEPKPRPRTTIVHMGTNEERKQDKVSKSSRTPSRIISPLFHPLENPSGKIPLYDIAMPTRKAGSGQSIDRRTLIGINKPDKQDLLKKFRQLQDRLTGANLEILNEIRYKLPIYSRESYQHLPNEDQDQDQEFSHSTLTQDSDFSIDGQQNFTDYFPTQNPRTVINSVRKLQKRTRKTYRQL